METKTEIYLKIISKKLTTLIIITIIPYMIITFIIALMYFGYKKIERIEKETFIKNYGNEYYKQLYE